MPTAPIVVDAPKRADQRPWAATAHAATLAIVESLAVALMERLGLSDDELCEMLGEDPIAIITDELDHRPELPILLALTAEAADRVGPSTLRSWLRRSGPNGVPARHLAARDFEAFEDALAVLAERGFVIRRA